MSPHTRCDTESGSDCGIRMNYADEEASTKDTN